MLQIKSRVVVNQINAPRYRKLILSCPAIAKKAEPGQFVEVKVTDDGKPLLRRPLSIHRVSKSNIELLYEIVGSGTEILSRRKSGEYLDLIGPLGHGFDYLKSSVQCAKNILVAGGMGVAPLAFLAEKLNKPLVLIGAKTKSHLLCVNEFKALGCEVKIATDDGSAGFKGYVSKLLENILRTNSKNMSRTNGITVYACGPKPLLEAISIISQKNRIKTQVSLEEHMACGIGACLGCVVETKDGYKRVCKEGPVFSAQDIIW